MGYLSQAHTQFPQLVLALAAMLTCTGCSELISLYPFVTDKEAVQDARLPGVWVDADGAAARRLAHL